MEKQTREHREGGGAKGLSNRRPTAGNQSKDRKTVFRAATIATLVIAVVGIGVAFAVTIVNGSSRAVAVGTASSNEPAASGTIDFQPTKAIDAGKVEGLPAGAVQKADNPRLLPVGSAAPDFTLSTASGTRVSLSDFRGKTVLLVFFATWCPHCQAEAPHLKAIMSTLSPEKFAMISVNADSEDAASLEAFDRYFGITTPSLLDPGTTPGNFYHQGSTGPVTLAYKVGIFPTFYIIDPWGTISWRADHEQPDALLLEKLKDASGS